MPALDSGLDVDVADFRRRVCAVSGISTPSLMAVDRFVKALKGRGLWDGLPFIAPMVGYDLNACLVPLKNTVTNNAIMTNLNLVAGDYNESLGAQTNGTTKAIDTGFYRDATVGGVYAYLRTTQTSNTTLRCPFGVTGTSNRSQSVRGNRDSTGGSTAGAIRGQWGQNNTQVAPSTTGGLVAGGWHAIRRGATDSELYLNGNSVASDATSLSVAAFGTTTYYILALNNLGTTLAIESGSYVSGASVDTGFSSAQALQLHRIWQDFQRSLRRSV